MAIAEVPGSGKLLGVYYYKGAIYAFRNSPDGLSADMYAGDAAGGWQSIKSGLAPNGRYTFCTYAFQDEEKMYGASGVHPAFEWDGETWRDIITPQDVDEPSFVIGHRKHLFMSFKNRIHHSGIGDPFAWTAVSGTEERLLSRNCTGFAGLPNGSLGIFTRGGIILLAGSSPLDWVANSMVEYSNHAGAVPYSVQSFGSQTLFVDSRGVTTMGASDTSSDMFEAIISHDLDDRYRDQWIHVVATTVIRAKGQYRVFFESGSAVIGTFAGESVMWTEMTIPHPVRCIHSTEDEKGNELIYFGSDDGYVRQMELGTSFDGEPIKALMQPAPYSAGAKNTVKRWRRVFFDTASTGLRTLTVKPVYSLEHDTAAKEIKHTPEYDGDGALLNQATLNQAILGAGMVRDGEIELEGHSEYIGLIFQSESDDEDPWEIDAYTIDYFNGRKRR